MIRPIRIKTGLSAVAMMAASVTGLSANAEINTLTADAAYKMVQRGELVLIDVRTPTEWALTGVPKDSRLANLSDSDFLQKARGVVFGDTEAPVALICRSGNRSTKAAEALEKAGFSHVYNITEGVEGNKQETGWIKRGLPTDPFIPPN